MPAFKRFKTEYPGVFYIVGETITGRKKEEKIYYIRYRKDGEMIEEKVGRQTLNDMTPARAAKERARRMAGDIPTNKEKRDAAKDAAAEKKWTIEALWDEYKKNRPDLKGLKTDQNRFDLHIKDALGGKEPAQISPIDVDRVRIHASKTHEPATVKNILELLRRIVNFGFEKRLIPSLGFRIKLPKVSNLKTEDLTPEQVKRLLEAIDKDDHPQAGTLLKMALFTGMRRGELFRLKWDDIDFERGFILLRNPKGGEDQKIPLNEMAKGIIQRHNEKRKGFVFPGRKGEQRTDINKAVGKIKKAAELPEDFRAIHGLRHVYASMLASSGRVDLFTLQKLLTHKSPGMTLRYAHLRDEALKRAAQVAGNLISEIMTNKSEENNVNILPTIR